MAGRKPDEATVACAVKAACEACVFDKCEYPNCGTVKGCLLPRAIPVAIAAIGSGTQGRDAVIVERERCLIEAKNAVSIALDMLTDDDCVEAEWLHEQLDEHFRALASPEKVTAPELAEVDEAIEKLRQSVEPTPPDDDFQHQPEGCTCLEVFGEDPNCKVHRPSGMITVEATPAAASDLRERAVAFVAVLEGQQRKIESKSDRNWITDWLTQVFAAIRAEAKAEAKAEGWEEAVTALSPIMDEDMPAPYWDTARSRRMDWHAAVIRCANRIRALAANRPSPTGRDQE